MEFYMILLTVFGSDKTHFTLFIYLFVDWQKGVKILYSEHHWHRENKKDVMLGTRLFVLRAVVGVSSFTL